MREALRVLITLFILPGLAAGLALILVFEFVVKPQAGLRDDQMAWLEDAARIIGDRYFEEIPSDQLVFEAIRGMARSRDRYSDFVDPDHYDAFREENEGQYVGIGFMVYNQGDPLSVLYPFPRSPASEGGLEVGDRIIGVDGVDCTGQDSADIIGRIKDKEGTPVVIEVEPYSADGEPRSPTYERELMRRIIEKPSVFDARIIDPETGTAYVRLAAFQESSAEDLERNLEQLSREGMKSLVLDMRRNRGGLLDEAIAVVSLFLDDAVVLRTQGRTEDANHVYETVGEAIYPELPIVLLVDDSTASAAEVVAGALQDHLRALLVGDRTYGKGVVQSVIPRRYEIDGEPRVAVIKITTSRYLTPSGRAIEQVVGRSEAQRGGLVPDVWFPLDDQREWERLERHLADREIPEETWRLIRERCPEHRKMEPEFDDRQLLKAVEVLRGQKAFRAVD